MHTPLDFEVTGRSEAMMRATPQAATNAAAAERAKVRIVFNAEISKPNKRAKLRNVRACETAFYTHELE